MIFHGSLTLRMYVPLIRPGITQGLSGTQLADERESLLWGFVNTLHMQTVRLDRAVDRLAPELKQLQRSQDGTEINAWELERIIERARNLGDRRDAFEQLRDAAARRELALEAAIEKLNKYHLLILDDLAYVTKDQAETSVLFELISARYEHRSILITANQPFGEWNKIFPDPAMTLAAVDRLVHHATIFELNVESYRQRSALSKKRGRGHPPSKATPKTIASSDK